MLYEMNSIDIRVAHVFQDPKITYFNFMIIVMGMTPENKTKQKRFKLVKPAI